jgi:hypothetical protein
VCIRVIRSVPPFDVLDSFFADMLAILELRMEFRELIGLESIIETASLLIGRADVSENMRKAELRFLLYRCLTESSVAH